MNSFLSHLGTRRLIVGAVFATVSAAVAACGGSSIYGQSSAAQPPPAAAYTAPMSIASPPPVAQAPAATPTAPAPPSLLGAMSISVTGHQQTVLTDAEGRTLYYFTPDKGGRVTCTGGCASAWPPLVVRSTAGLQLPAGVSGTVGSVMSPDGSMQITLNGWPLYRYAGDTSPGQANGEGSGNTWFVAASGIPHTA